MSERLKRALHLAMCLTGMGLLLSEMFDEQ